MFGKRIVPPDHAGSPAAGGGLEKLGAAAQDMTGALMQAYRNEQGIHAETIIGAAAALCGEFALRAAAEESGQVLPESGWVVGGIADALLYSGEISAWTLIRVAAARAGADDAALPDMAEIVARTASAIGGSPFPPLSIPNEHHPHEWSPNACPRHRAAIAEIADRHGLSGEETVLALALSVSILISQTKQVIAPALTARLAADIMIGVSRMAPMQAEVT
jgi:hypothetical protein